MPFQGAMQFTAFPFLFKPALQHKKTLVVADILAIDRIKVTLAKRQVMYGVEQIGFADSVVPYKTIDLGRKNSFKLAVILKIDQG